MDFKKRALLEVEYKYTFRQSQQISSQTGLIGYLSADMDTDGNGFFSSWVNFRVDLKTKEFKKEFDDIINSLRENGDIFYNRKALAEYCYSNPQSKMSNTSDYYGIRIDTEKYAYLFRLNPNKGEYNVYCYCYVKQWLNQHIKEAEKGICFIDTNYKKLFCISDGESIRIKSKSFSDRDEVCRYVDRYHFEVGENLFHQLEFAERMEINGSKVIPLRKSLPEYAYVYVESEDCIGCIKKGENGFKNTKYGTSLPPEGKTMKAERMNSYNNVSKAQLKAMIAGSMFGWETPAADPNNYDLDGNLIIKEAIK